MPLSGLPADVLRDIGRALERLVDDPGSADLKKLQGNTDVWRLRVRGWRVMLPLDNATGTV
jgi:mRNA-degrading endonuclease RelE of RelBE toxin-antitoxin system